MRPTAHDNPNAIPRNGTDVPFLDLDDPSRRPPATARGDRHDPVPATDERPRRR